MCIPQLLFRFKVADSAIYILDAFTIRAVGQEDFSDIVVPEAPAALKQEQQK